MKKSTILKFLLLILIIFISFSCNNIKKSTVENYNRSFYQEDNQDKRNFSIVWHKRLRNILSIEDGVVEKSVPILFKDDGKSYLLVATSKGYLLSIDLEKGTILWKRQLLKGVFSNFIQYKEQIIFLSGDGNIYSIKPKGEVVWKTPLENERVTSIFVKYKNNVIFKTSKERVYSLNMDNGEPNWISKSYQVSGFKLDTPISPIIINRYIYIGFANGKFVIFNADNGKTQFETTLSTKEIFNDITGKIYNIDTTLYIPSANKGIIAFDINKKTIKWNTKIAANTGIIPFSKDEGIYFSSDMIVTINLKSGKIIKKDKISFDSPDNYRLYKGRYLILTSKSYGIIMLDTKRKLYYSFFIKSGVTTLPLILNNHLIFMSNSGSLYNIAFSMH